MENNKITKNKLKSKIYGFEDIDKLLLEIDINLKIVENLIKIYTIKKRNEKISKSKQL